VISALSLPGVYVVHLEANGQPLGRKSHFDDVEGNPLAIQWKGVAAERPTAGHVSLIVEIEMAVQVAPRGFSGFVKTRSRHEEKLQQVG
jgi:hypothetical protein